MINKNIYTLLFLLILFTVKIYSQFDNTWMGIWKGELFIYSKPGDEKVTTLHMELHISKTDSAGKYNWRIIYDDSTKDDRKYLLRTVDEKAGKYVIDEKDGIMLNAELLGNRLISRFSVQGSMLDISYTLESDKMVFEVSAGSDAPLETTKSNEDNVSVSSFNVTNYQKAYLFK